MTKEQIAQAIADIGGFDPSELAGLSVLDELQSIENNYPHASIYWGAISDDVLNDTF